MPLRERISDEDALAEFRKTQLAPARLSPLLNPGSVVLVNVAVGVGKSRAIDDLLDDPGIRNQFDRVLVLAELRASLTERRLLKANNPAALLLMPRPRKRCGVLDEAWRNHEHNGTTAFAKKHLCGTCPARVGCSWPHQYGEGLRTRKFIFGAQQLLKNNPRFAFHLKIVMRAKRLLMIIDEAAAVQASKRVTLTLADLKRFGEAIKRSRLSADTRAAYLHPVELLVGARTDDLQDPSWYFPAPTPHQTLAIQEAGISRDSSFKYLGYELYAFSKALPAMRWRGRGGDLTFISTPYVADATVIFAANMGRDYVQRQLGGRRVVAPLDRFDFHHAKTHIYNLKTMLGAASNFPHNMRQLLDFFALLIRRNSAHGKRTLLISRKKFKERCVDYLNSRLLEWSVPVTVKPADGAWDEDDSTSVPVIHYGLNGVNAFEHFDCAYCINSYYISEDILRAAVEDPDSDALKFPVQVRVDSAQRRRVAGAFEPSLSHTDADSIINLYYQQLETTTVLQAVGRVRYATRPREVIVFQASRIDGVDIEREFSNLSDARDYFGLTSGAAFDRRMQQERIAGLDDLGRTNAQIAAELGVSERTVRNRRAAHRRGST